MQFEILIVTNYADGKFSEVKYHPEKKFRSIQENDSKDIGEYLKESWKPSNLDIHNPISNLTISRAVWSFKRRIKSKMI